MRSYRIEFYWEERGTVEQGGMNDCRYHSIKRKPTKREMTKIERGLRAILGIMDLLPKAKVLR